MVQRWPSVLKGVTHISGVIFILTSELGQFGSEAWAPNQFLMLSLVIIQSIY